MSRCSRISDIGILGAFLFVANEVSSLLYAQMGYLSNREIGFYNSDIDATRVPLDQPISNLRLEYMATVNQHMGNKLFITATVPANADSELEIDAILVNSGESYPVELKEGYLPPRIGRITRRLP
jgi:hypothetical protein